MLLNSCRAAIAASALLLTSTPALSAEQTMMFGLVYTFGGDIGVSAKLLSQREANSVAGAVGVSWYPWAKNGKSFGFDVSAVYLFERNTALSIGWDFANKGLQLGTGFADINEDKKYRPYIVDGKFSALPPAFGCMQTAPSGITANVAIAPTPSC